MNRKQLFFYFVFICSLSINALSQNQREEVIITFDAPEQLSYGTQVDFLFFIENKRNGNRKPVPAHMNNYFSAECVNGNFYFESDQLELKGTLILAPYPKSYTDTIINLTIHVAYNQAQHDIYEKTSVFEFALNGTTDIILDYAGKNGMHGEMGSNERMDGLIFDAGNRHGGSGLNGVDGSDLIVKIAPFYNEQQDSLVLVKVFDSKDSLLSIYRLPTKYTSIKINVSGGVGGNGGNGKMGSNTLLEYRDGGRGGNGGNGGNGGFVKVLIHPTLAFLESAVKVNYSGGAGGNGGTGGRAGRSGLNAPFQFEGVPGSSGKQGGNGRDGMSPVFIVTSIDWGMDVMIEPLN